MADPLSAHRRTHHEYTYRLPTPPRIVVPPPTLTTDVPNLTVGGNSGDNVDMSFLKEMDLEDIIQRNTLLEWAYERRRQAQVILPWLYLGPMVAARDKAFLEREGITMVLAIRAKANSMMGAVQAAAAVCLEVATVEAATFYDLVGQFSETATMINRHIAQYRQHTLDESGQAALGKVLIFCESGNEKSAAVAAAYMMETLDNFDHIKAMQICQAQRFCVNFDDTAKNVLRSHWDILQAKRSVTSFDTQHHGQTATTNGQAQNGSLLVPTASRNPKRSIEDTLDEDDDVEMEDGMHVSDGLRFAGRDVTPFLDG
ncbi:FMI2 protein-like protein [Pyrenochaeta sp. DS3sAY3a]|nr:FMI2 protein-like protein [Pyrenochaeta sp. DS3sAY3a]